MKMEIKFRVPVVCQNGHKSFWFYRLNGLYEPITLLTASDYNEECKCRKHGLGVGWRQDGAEQLYTNLKDKNGVEIYKGDVLEIESPVSGCKSKHVVYFEDGSFFLGNAGRELSYFARNDYVLEIIGNIFKNPELLNQTP